MLTFLRNLWAYRGFVTSSIRNEFVARFARSRLGGLWMIIHPLAQVAIYALILSNVLAAKLPGIDNPYAYALYLTAGITAWSLFAEIVGRCLTLFIDNGNLMKKMRFPHNHACHYHGLLLTELQPAAGFSAGGICFVGPYTRYRSPVVIPTNDNHRHAGTGSRANSGRY